MGSTRGRFKSGMISVANVHIFVGIADDWIRITWPLLALDFLPGML